MANLVEWILEKAQDEQIEAVVIGNMGWGDYRSETVPNYNAMPRGKVISWEEAQKWLNYSFSEGYGAPKCNAIYAWTASKIIFIGQYDGATFPCAVPRNPVPCDPYMPGNS